MVSKGDRLSHVTELCKWWELTPKSWYSSVWCPVYPLASRSQVGALRTKPGQHFTDRQERLTDHLPRKQTTLRSTTVWNFSGEEAGFIIG